MAPSSAKPKKADVDPKEAFELVLLNAHRIAVSLGEMGVFQNTQFSVAEWAILKALGDRQEVPVKEIVAGTGMSRQRLRKLIAELEAKGAVAPGRPDAEDKRTRTVSATPTAAKILSLISVQLQALRPESVKPKADRGLLQAARAMNNISKTMRRKVTGRRSKGGKGGAGSEDQGASSRPRRS